MAPNEVIHTSEVRGIEFNMESAAYLDLAMKAL